MTTYKIDSNVPLPPKRGGRPTGDFSLALRALEVGDSFFAHDKNSQRLSGFLTSLRKQGLRFSVRAVTEPHPDTGIPVSGIRVWRTK